jgi:hypothetical protein
VLAVSLVRLGPAQPQVVLALPLAPCPALVTDWDTTYQFLLTGDDGLIWSQTGSQLSTGWSLIPNSTFGGFGRKVGRWAASRCTGVRGSGATAVDEHTSELVCPGKEVFAATSALRPLCPTSGQVFIKGDEVGSGCWFSTDYVAEQT